MLDFAVLGLYEHLATYFRVRGFGQQGLKGALDPAGKGFSVS